MRSASAGGVTVEQGRCGGSSACLRGETIRGTARERKRERQREEREEGTHVCRATYCAS